MLEDKYLIEDKIEQVLSDKGLILEGHVNICKYDEELDKFMIYRRKIKNYKEFYISMGDRTHVFKVQILDYSILEILYSEVPEMKELGMIFTFTGGNLMNIEIKFTKINYSFDIFKKYYKEFTNKLDFIKSWL